MAGLRSWLLGIILTAFAGALARRITPPGKEQAMVRMVGALLLALALLKPLGSLPWTELSIEAGSFRGQAARQADTYRQNQQEELSAIIAEKTEAYIWDKALALGLDCVISVSVSAGESGIPLPDAVTITGAYSDELASWIEEGVGIPAEKQIWLEASAWTETKESGS